MSEIDEVMVATLQEATFGDGYNKMVSMLADKLVEHYGITRSTAVNCAKSKSDDTRSGNSHQHASQQ